MRTLGPVTTETLAARAGLRTVAAPVAARIDPPVAVTLLWVPLVLLLDRGAGIWEQRALGVGTWLLLVLLLRRELPLVRAQVAVVVVFATAVEYTFSPFLEVYVYRLGNVPAFVPPGHGLVYLCALAMGRSAWVHRRTALLVVGTVLLGGLYAAWGLFVSARPDALGRVLVPLPARLPGLGPLPHALRRGVRRGHLPRAARHLAGHLDLADPRPDRAGQHRQPPVRRRRRLRLVRPGRRPRRPRRPHLHPGRRHPPPPQRRPSPSQSTT